MIETQVCVCVGGWVVECVYVCVCVKSHDDVMNDVIH